jgi:hypothetical protein
MSMPDMNAEGPFCMDPAVAVWTLVRELVTQQRSVARVGRTLAALQAQHADNNYEEIISLSDDLKNASDMVALKHMWYTKTLPSLVAQFALVLEVHDTFGDGPVTIDNPIDAALWRNKYFVAVDDLTVTSSAQQKKSDGA